MISRKNVFALLVIVFISLLCNNCSVYAQIPILSEANGYRNGDQLCKILVDYVNPGSKGVDEVWRLGRISDSGVEFKQMIATKGDTIAIFEPETIQHLIMRGDTLYEKGVQSRRSYCIYDKERPILHYSFQYGDSISGYFSGKCRDENTLFCKSGWGYTVADGMGFLTDGIDTLHHITRLHLHDEYTVQQDDVSCALIETDRYAWYCAGCRYPVMESWLRVAKLDSVQIPLDSISCLYLPIMQGELVDDLSNGQILTWISEQEKNNGHNTTPTICNINAKLASDGMSVTVSYMVSDGIDIEFTISDVVGAIIGYSFEHCEESGDYCQTIPLTRHPVGNMIMLGMKSETIEANLKILR